MPELIVIPANPLVEAGQTVDVVVTADTHVNRFEFRDAGTGSVTVVASRVDTFSGWSMNVVSPITAQLLSSDSASATFRLTAGASSTTEVTITANATGAFSGALSKPFPVDVVFGEDAIPLSGNIGGTLATGTTHKIIGDVALTSDLVVEGTLLSVDTFVLEGNGFQILVQDGGRLSLVGETKTSWVRDWGDSVSGWVSGDRIGIAPTAAGVWAVIFGTWGGSWGATTRPANSGDVTMVDASVVGPEVANLTRSITLQNLRRIHFHDGAGVQTLKHLAVVNSGTTGVLADYPLHFHLNGEASRGSLIEGVVVEDGNNHAFVAHGSHGITFRDTAAVNVINHAYWWDAPFDNPANNSNDILYERALVLGADPDPNNPATVAGFHLGTGTGNGCIDSVAVAVRGGGNSAGFFWSETSNQPPNVWLFEDNLAHNNKQSGIRVWQNTGELHVVARFVGYRNDKAGIEHGAYRNHYLYTEAVLTDNTFDLRNHALSNGPGMLFEDILTSATLSITKHNQASSMPVVYRRCTFPSVLMRETDDGGIFSGVHWFEDCGVVPADFNMSGIIAGSVIEIYEDGLLTDRWAGGSWS